MVVMKMKFPFQKRVKLAQGLWLLSWGATVAGALTFSLGCILKTELRRRAEVMDNSDIHIVPNTLMIVGVASLGINYFASKICQDALDAGPISSLENLLEAIFCHLLLLHCPHAAGCHYELCDEGQPGVFSEGGPEERPSLLQGHRHPGPLLPETEHRSACRWSFSAAETATSRTGLRCSGSAIVTSTSAPRNRVKSNVDGRYLVDGVPFSCCNPSSPRPCIQYQITNNSAHYNYEYQTEELNIYLRGCREALLNYYMGLMNTIGGGVLSVFLLQGSVLVSLRFLQTSMEAVAGNENTEIETEGYLLEKGVKETIKEYTDPVLKFLLLKNQVEEDSSGPAPADVPATT
ncbi:hypothetical protein fugu_009313 [Takifugu bimaculatus]|uniref:Tetraspanin n=1 Tax=Takifugu bimaculatus TaxID=433685 RepID=A0A4Z2AZS1_9TELE|nr:hypothetical protein fugu_009313 [Takifugu bimaculatus]